MKPVAAILALLCASQSAAFAQATDQKKPEIKKDSLKTYTTKAITSDAPHIDGRLDDDAWKLVSWGGNDFRQLSPDKGKPASVQTRFKILYDDKNLYVAIQCLDPEPSKIVRRMSRRDTFEGDMVEINIDSYYDKRTAFSFTASVSGVKGDEYVSNNGDDWDPGWDPIWYLQTSIDAEGWNAEFRIPLSQLRFTNKEELVWGLEITRIFFRNQERSIWQYIPPDAGGWVHLFGELNGINGIKPQKQLEVQPFIVAMTERFEQEPGNPYRTGKSSDANVGLDAKIGLTSDITLDLTVNPDFGQVEADPSQVNLSAFELYFQERRPFFIEGNNTLNFPVGQINNNNLFYSRRIGRPPQTDPMTDPDDTDDGVNEYLKGNKNSTILGAAKITGKNKHGFSWAVLESFTQREYAEIDSAGHTRYQAIEPATNYFVSRVQQDINKGNTLVGGMFTATTRNMRGNRNLSDQLHKSAYTGGVDFTHHWKKRTYYVSGRAAFSHVRGSEKAISATQLSSERFFQRPDNFHKDYDPGRTSLTGTGGQVMIGKKSGNIVTDLGVLWQSPEFDLNDLGFLLQTDNISQWFWMQYRIMQPKGVTRSQRYNINQWSDYDFGKRNTGSGYNVNAHVQFKSFWYLGGGITASMDNISNADLRGGPSIRYPGGMYYWNYIRSDNRKKLSGELSTEIFRGKNNYSSNESYNLDLTYMPVNALNVTVSSSLFRNRNHMQWVSSSDETGSTEYVVGEIDQTVARVSLRVTYMITPNLSVQYWGQPFGTIGKYKNFKTITDARAKEYANRYVGIPAANLQLTENIYDVDLDGNGMRDLSFDNPDFNFGQFRSNMVIRWEYIPGSTVFLVWTRERNGGFYEDNEGQRYSPVLYPFQFDERAHDIFLLKFTYRFVL
jgi:hypothetical protein